MSVPSNNDLDNILDSAAEECLPNTSKVDVEDDVDNEPKKVTEIPNEFPKLMIDFINDVTTTFPEYKPIVSKWWGFDSFTNEQVATLFTHCLKVYPPRFTDIIYKNIDMFDANSTTNVDFLPGVSFKYLWSCEDITDQTRDVLWKYLQTITLCVVGSVDTENMDNGMKEVLDKLDENSFKDSLCDTINDIQKVFSSAMNGDDEENNDSSETSTPGISADDFQEKLNGILGGKIGALAEDILNDTLQNINQDDFADAQSAEDVLKKLCEKPGSLIEMAQNVSSKLKQKMDSGEYDQQELFSEMSSVLQNVNDMPGMDMMKNMMSGIARSTNSEGDADMPDIGNLSNMMEMMMGGLKKGQRVDKNAVDRQIKRKNQITEMKQRIERKKAKEATLMMEQLQQAAMAPPVPALTDDQLVELFEDDKKDTDVEAKKTSSKKKKQKNKK
jgi:hypothetical protein